MVEKLYTNLNGQHNRDLTTLEYVILGFLAAKPQSGYAVINRLSMGFYRWSASTGSIYPVLKRLEKQGLISSQLEVVYEARPRKVYRLQPPGEALLDSWLRQAPTMREVLEEFDIALHKFLIAETRLSRQEVLDWLGAYTQIVKLSQAMNGVMRQAAAEEISAHEQLIMLAVEIEADARLAWIKAAQDRLSALQNAAAVGNVGNTEGS